MIVGRNQGCHSGASPSLVGCSFFDNSLGCRGIPKLRLFYPSFIHHKITQNLKTSITQNSNKTFVRSVIIRNETTTIITVENLLLFYFCIISTVFQIFYGKYSSNKTIESSKQAHNTKKIESIKKQTICSNLETSNTYVTPKILKN